MEGVETESAGADGRQWRASVVWIALLWWWTIPSAYLWHRAERSEAVLPYVPQAIWGLPGGLWSVAPLAYVVVLLGASYYVAVLTSRKRPPRRVAIVARVFALVVTVTHVIWGSALLAGLAELPNYPNEQHESPE